MKEFKEVGKRMPYSVPEGFFDEARRAAAEITVERRMETHIRGRRTLTTAAAIVLVTASFVGVYANRNKLTIKFDQFITQASDETLEEMAAGYAADFEEIVENL